MSYCGQFWLTPSQTHRARPTEGWYGDPLWSDSEIANLHRDQPDQMLGTLNYTETSPLPPNETSRPRHIYPCSTTSETRETFPLPDMSSSRNGIRSVRLGAHHTSQELDDENGELSGLTGLTGVTDLTCDEVRNYALIKKLQSSHFQICRAQETKLLPIPKFSDFREIATGDDWFKVYEITPDLYAISEQNHYESTLISLMIGDTGAILVDTGCGIGDLKKVVGRITDKPILVVNTHTHLDHLGSNRDFDEIMMFDHPLSRQVSEFGASSEQLAKEILANNLFEGPRPTGFKDVDCRIPPFKVARWLKDGDCIEFGGKRLSVLHTPGEAADHICLLNAEDRILFSGDIILAGAVWTHLDGGSLNDLAASYERLMRYRSDFEMIMPSHNVPWIKGDYLPAIKHAANQVNSGEAAWELVRDPWGRTLRKYPFDSFSFITNAA